jgi:hypothetical protein
MHARHYPVPNRSGRLPELPGHEIEVEQLDLEGCDTGSSFVTIGGAALSPPFGKRAPLVETGIEHSRPKPQLQARTRRPKQGPPTNLKQPEPRQHYSDHPRPQLLQQLRGLHARQAAAFE